MAKKNLNNEHKEAEPSEETSNKKDSLKKIIKMMEYVDNNKEVASPKFIDEFDNDGFVLFQKYCVGNDIKDENYAKTISSSWFLTQRGVRKLYDLRRIIAEEKRANWIMVATITIAIFAILQVCIVGLQTWKLFL